MSRLHGATIVTARGANLEEVEKYCYSRRFLVLPPIADFELNWVWPGQAHNTAPVRDRLAAVLLQVAAWQAVALATGRTLVFSSSFEPGGRWELTPANICPCVSVLAGELPRLIAPSFT